jgi:hypothetical protein
MSQSTKDQLATVRSLSAACKATHRAWVNGWTLAQTVRYIAADFADIPEMLHNWDTPTAARAGVVPSQPVRSAAPKAVAVASRERAKLVAEIAALKAENAKLAGATPAKKLTFTFSSPVRPLSEKSLRFLDA